MIEAGAELAVGGVAVSGLLVGLVTLARQLGVSSRFAPLVAVLFGVAFGALAAVAGDVELITGVVGGLYTGLGAVGLHATVTHAGPSEPAHAAPE